MKAFFAYPSKPAVVGQLIEGAVKSLPIGGLEVQTWVSNDICGLPLTDPIFDNILKSDVVVADITRLNFNVTFEVGFAIANGKKLLLTKHKDTVRDNRSDRVGVFDTLGYVQYETTSDIIAILESDVSPKTIKFPSVKDSKSPVYIVEPPIRDELITKLVSRVKKTRIRYRSFNPNEDVRLSATDAIRHVSESFGVMIPILDEAYEDAEVHNLRGAFVAGLALGAGIPLSLVQHYGGPAPLDVRDLVSTIKHPDDISSLVQAFAISVTDATDNFVGSPTREAGSLEALNIGDSTAENEFEGLDHYFHNTDQYLKAERGEVNLVVGRKGTGKTAIFGHLRNRKRRDRSNVIVDLRPEGYQLIRLREEVFAKLTAGAKNHLIMAFWEFILYIEICNKLIEGDRQRHMADADIHKIYTRIRSRYGDQLKFEEADFSERLLMVSEHIVQEYRSRYSASDGVTFSTASLTEMLYKTDIKDVRSDVVEYLRLKKSAVILFDNLDRGWPESGLTNDDILVIRCLIDAARKVQRDLRQNDIDFSSIVFLRNDVYQILMRRTADFGKDLSAQLDWTDTDQIKELIRLRMIMNSSDKNRDFNSLWRRYFVPYVDGVESSDYILDRSLRRPRNVIKMIYESRASAINLGHKMIQDSDVKKGVERFSRNLLIEADRELTDIAPIAEGILYNLIGENSVLSRDDLESAIFQGKYHDLDRETIIDRLLYFGFLGIKRGRSTKYIYDVGYDMNLVHAEIRKFSEDVRYEINPAFYSVLYINEG